MQTEPLQTPVKSNRIFLIPHTWLLDFLQYLKDQTHDIDTIDNATLEQEWENYSTAKNNIRNNG